MKIPTFLTLIATLFAVPMDSARAAEKSPIPPQQTTGIKAVLQVSEPKEKNGVNKGLFYAKKLLETYEAQGVPASEIDLRLVYHGEGAAALLSDAAYERLSAKAGPNPNKELVSELKKAGVHFEICANTMKEKKIATDELLPEVDIVAGAYIRLIDLQKAGYSYIQVE